MRLGASPSSDFARVSPSGRQWAEFAMTIVGMLRAPTLEMSASERGARYDRGDLQTVTFVETRPVEAAGERSIVLIVDDDEDVRFSTSGVLCAVGYDVIEACDGADALVRLLAAVRLPTAIITDLSMPRLDGWQFIDVLRADGRWLTIPIVVISASPDPPLGIPCLRKPVQRQVLLDTLVEAGAGPGR
jgi:two-component system, chemotaxis family, chemotaxis protein CheY